MVAHFSYDCSLKRSDNLCTIPKVLDDGVVDRSADGNKSYIQFGKSELSLRGGTAKYAGRFTIIDHQLHSLS